MKKNIKLKSYLKRKKKYEDVFQVAITLSNFLDREHIYKEVKERLVLFFKEKNYTIVESVHIIGY